jgi:gamma-glutamylcyclotransferase (GGCT)/AIG2-like uncharacterized protein YtfP
MKNMGFHLVFVYGTLKTGFVNNSVLEGMFVSVARTLPYYRMYDYGSFPVLKKDKFGVEIEGELWLVRNLEALDEFESDLYCRELILLDKPSVFAYAYLFANAVDGLMECGSNWQKESNHDLQESTDGKTGEEGLVAGYFQFEETSQDHYGTDARP